ncbi:MAG: endonuclease/exonuclease/phosphatase family protein [Candidatus Promineifilaceae bacterium]|jgi:endonuclease/exonuclease/phosphatase family metal-dependent hydrolase
MGLIVRVMSFNIRTITARDYRHAWDLRKHLVIERVRAFDPDFLGMQECQEGEQEQFIRQQLPDYEFFGVRRGDDSRTGREMAPLLIRKSAFELLDGGTFWLSKTPEEQGSKLLGAVFPRTATWARLRSRVNPARTIFFFNTHFDYIPLILPQAAEILRERIHAITSGMPTVLTGDFNTPTGGGAYRRLTEAVDSRKDDSEFRLIDVSIDSGTTSGSPAGTIHKFGMLNRPLIIDWILASTQFTAVTALIDDYNDDGLYPSDHYPVIATLALP